MTFLWPAAFGFAALLPAVLALYFLRLRRRPRLVSSTWLWRRAVDTYRVNRPFDRFRNHLLLWLQLLLVALLVLALSRPVVVAERATSGVHVFLVDCSASMGAREESASTRLDEARRLVREAVEAMGDGDRAAIVAFSDRAFVAAPLTTERDVLLAGLERIEPTSRPTRVDEAWATALSIVRKFDASDLHLVTDGGFEGLPPLVEANAAVHWIPVGATRDNLGIVALESRRSDADGAPLEIFARVASRRTAPARTRVELRLDGRLADAQDIEVPAEGDRGIVFRRRGEVASVAEVALPGGDALAADDRAWVPVRSAEPVRVLLAGEPSPFLVEGLRTHPDVRLERIGAADFARARPAPGAADLFVVDGVPAGPLEAGTWLLLGAVPSLEGFEAGEPVADVVLTRWDREHPLTRGIAFSELHPARLVPGADPPWMRPLVWSDRGTVVSGGERGRLRVVLVRFALLDSDWPLRSGFPLFLSNVVRWAGDRGPGARGVVRPGEPIEALLPAGALAATVVRPDGSEEELPAGPDGRVVVADTDLQGAYRIDWGDGERVLCASLLDPAESDIVVRASLPIGERRLEPLEASRLVDRELTGWLAAAALAVLALEWFVYALRRNS